ETAKSWEVVHRLLTELIERRTERSGSLVGVGGGVVCDLTAFVASIYARGITLILIPTSLLAMVDAALGGKTGIDFGGYKNMVGTFYPADALVLLPECVATLSDREYRSGLAEVIKSALLSDETFVEHLEDHGSSLLSREPRVVEEVVRRSLAVKGKIASEDFREGGGRAVLNLGHTFGHALEAVTGMSRFTHGEAVAWGIRCATRLSYTQGRCSAGYLARVERILDRYGFERVDLCGTTAQAVDVDRLIAALYYDKKSAEGALRFVLQSKVGEQEVVTVTEADVRQVLSH
ncbi:MAG: 3-dehydroquinate synthase, partial [Firmicutes bacterium]|nr:3-dehydroquinate synthase [Bacillota bacterium]